MAEAPRCLYKLKQEFAHGALEQVKRGYRKPREVRGNDGLYEVCVTPRLHWTLFGDVCSPYDNTCPPRDKKCGTFACVYPHKDPDKIIKITIDPTDVENLRRSQGLAHVPRLYSAVTVPTTAPAPVYAMVVERLKTIPPLNEVKQRSYTWNTCTRDEAFAVAKPDPTTIEQEARVIPEFCCTTAGRLKPACARLTGDMYRTIQQLRLRGVSWRDVHPGNIGWSVKDRRWKVLDLGFDKSKPPEPEDLPHLAGARRRRR